MQLVMILLHCYSYLPLSHEICREGLEPILVFFVVVLGVATIIGLLVGLPMVIIQMRRIKYDGATLIGLVLIFNSLWIFFVIPKVNRIVFEYGIHRTTKNYLPLIDALEDFKKKNGNYPQTLSELVPRYLPEKFQNDVCAFPKNKYEKTEKHLDYETSGYYLEVFPSLNASSGVYYFAYWPSQKYPPCENSKCKIDGWYLSVD
jgi:hypothetical protein